MRWRFFKIVIISLLLMLSICAGSADDNDEIPDDSKILFLNTQRFEGNNLSIFNIEWSGYLDLANMLKKKGFIVEEMDIDPITYNQLEDYDIVVISGSDQRVFSSNEIDAIVDFVKNSGGLVLLGEHGPIKNAEKIHPTLNAIGNYFGINFEYDLVCDPTDHLYFENDPDEGVEFFFIRTFKNHRITEDVEVLLHNCGESLTISNPAEVVATGAEDTWCNKNSYWDGKYYTCIYDSSEPIGYPSVMGIAEYDKGRVIAIGDSNMWGNDWLSKYDHTVLAENIFIWALGEDKEEKPNLVIESISWDVSIPLIFSYDILNPTKEDQIKFKVETINTGDQDADAFYLEFYIDGEYFENKYINDGLDAGDTRTDYFYWTADKCGDIQVMAWADASSMVDESNDEDNTKTAIVNVVCEQPCPKITAVDIDPTTCVNEDEYATISVTVKNDGGSSSEGYISVSFPNDETIIGVSGTGFENTPYPKGSDKLWGKDGQIPSSEDPLAELKELQWDEGQEETLVIIVEPNSGSDKVEFYIRAALKNDADEEYERDPASSDISDQQGWPVEKYSVDVCEFEEVKIRGEILEDLPIISFYSFDVKIDEILNDPTGNLEEGETVNVYGHRSGPAQVDDVTVGAVVEVFGEYRGDVGTYEQIFLSDSDHYVKNIEQEKPILKLSNIDIYPEICVKEDESATISVTYENSGGPSSEGYISVSFPNDETILEVSGTGFENTPYPKGSDKLWGIDGHIPSSDDPLAELKEIQWDKGQKETLTVTVKPNSGSDKIVFYLRAALKNDIDETYERNPTLSNDFDQQGWPVYNHSMDSCNKYPNLIITEIYTNENDKKIYYTIKNIGGITAGPSDSYLYIDDMSTRIASDHVLLLGENEERDLYFDYSYTCYGDSNLIKVCANGKSEFKEADTDDNCKIITKECGSNPESLIVDILNPENDFSVVQGVSEIVKARVTDNFGNSISELKVEATFTNGDEKLTLYDDGAHSDGDANDGTYANEWVPTTIAIGYTETACTINVSAYHSSFGRVFDEVSGIITLTEKPLNLNIITPNDRFTVNKSIPQLIRIKVTDESGNVVPSSTITKSEASFSNGDSSILLFDDGAHHDGSADDGIYANVWIPENINSDNNIDINIKIKVYTGDNVLIFKEIEGILTPNEFVLLDTVSVYESDPLKSSVISVYYNVSKEDPDLYNLFLEINRKNENNLEYLDYTINSFGELSISISEDVDSINYLRRVYGLNWSEFKQEVPYEYQWPDGMIIPQFLLYEDYYEDTTIYIKTPTDIEKKTYEVLSIANSLIGFLPHKYHYKEVTYVFGFLLGGMGYTLESIEDIQFNADLIIGKDSIYKEFTQYNTRDTIIQSWLDDDKEYESVVTITPLKFQTLGKNEIIIQLFSDLDGRDILYNRKISINILGIDEENVQPNEKIWSDVVLANGFEVLDNEIMYSSATYDPHLATAISVSRKVSINDPNKQILFFEISRKTDPENDNEYYINLRNIIYKISFDEDTDIVYSKIKDYEIGERNFNRYLYKNEYKIWPDGDQLTEDINSFIPQYFEYTDAMIFPQTYKGRHHNFYHEIPPVSDYNKKIAKSKMLFSFIPYCMPINLLCTFDSILEIVWHNKYDVDLIKYQKLYEEIFDTNERDLVVRSFLHEETRDDFESIVSIIPIILDNEKPITKVYFSIIFSVIGEDSKDSKTAAFSKEIILDKNFASTQPDFESKTTMYLECPANLHAYNDDGKHVGLNSDGTIDLEIPLSYYEGANSGRETITIFGNSSFLFEVEGYDDGEFNLTFISQSVNNGIVNRKYSRIPLSQNTKATIFTNEINNPTYSIQIDNNSDGTIDYSQLPNSTEEIILSSTIYVPIDETSIQEAINTANAYDTIFILDGVYNESITVNKSLFIIGEDKNTTIIDGNGNGKCIQITANNITISGFTIQKGSDGIYLDSSDNCIIKENIIRNNHDGIQLINSNNNIITNNLLSNNILYLTGIYLSSSNNNNIYHNNFIDNGIDQASDDTGTNLWDNGYPSGGNYWSDYTGTDNNSGTYQNLSDSDGIGDAHYFIPGSGDAVDRYPFVKENGWTANEESENTETDTPKDEGSSSGSSGGGGGGGGGTSGESYNNILLSETERENIYKDSKINYSFNTDGNIIRYINFTALSSSGKVAAKVEILKNTSALVDSVPPDTVYKNLNIWVGNRGWASSKNIANPTVNFKVKNSWVSDNNIDRSTIRLIQYSDGKWNSLVTSQIHKDSDYLYFEAKTDGFSSFAVTGNKVSIVQPGEKGITTEPTVLIEETAIADEASTQTSDEEKTGIPGFGIIVCIFVLLITVGMFRKSKKQNPR